MNRYEVKFYPAWERGPADVGTYHLDIGKSGPFRTLPAAKKAAERYLVREPDWRAEIYRVGRTSTTRVLYSNRIGHLIRWVRAR